VSQDLLVAGQRYCLQEIAASRKTLLDAARSGAAGGAIRFLFLRSARKLTLRFSPFLWGDDDKAGKIAALVSSIEEDLEELDPSREVPKAEKLEKLTSSVYETCLKLESLFMYESLPVSQVRAISSWAHIRHQADRKTVIIENAEKMLDGARNALLKMLEEPPENTLFILTTANRQALMPTILSRLRTYRFDSRAKEAQAEVLKRIFRWTGDASGGDAPTIAAYLDSFLPVNPETASRLGEEFLGEILAGRSPSPKAVSSQANNFDPPLLLASFFDGITGVLKRRVSEAAGLRAEKECEAAAKCARAISEAWTRITVYKQNPASSLELLAQSIREALW
jgi:DNA polymerase-3 subunit gamma/tau